MNKINNHNTKTNRQYGEAYCLSCDHIYDFLKLAYWTDDTYKCPLCFKSVEINHLPSKIIKIGEILPSKKPIIIIILDGLYIAGAQKHCLYLLDIFRELGFDTIVISLEGGGLWTDIFIEKSSCVIISNSMFELTWSNIAELLSEDSIQRIRFFSTHIVTPTLWAVKNLPEQFRIHSNLHSEPSEHEVFSQDTLKQIINRCENVIFPSKKTLEVFINYSIDFSINKKKLLVLDNLLYNTDLRTNTKIKSSNSVNIAVVSRIDDDKFSIPLFINTIKILTEIISNLKVKVAGHGELYEELEIIIRREQLCEIISLEGFVINTTYIYDWATLVFLPSKRESMPYVMLESLSYNIPIVLPNCGYTIYANGNEYIYPFKLGIATDAANNIIKAINEHEGNSIKNNSISVDKNIWLEQIRQCYFKD